VKAMGKEKKLTPEEAKAVLIKEQEEKQQKCRAEIHKMLEKYGMQLQGYAIVSATNVRVVPKK